MVNSTSLRNWRRLLRVKPRAKQHPNIATNTSHPVRGANTTVGVKVLSYSRTDNRAQNTTNGASKQHPRQYVAPNGPALRNQDEDCWWRCSRAALVQVKNVPTHNTNPSSNQYGMNSQWVAISAPSNFAAASPATIRVGNHKNKFTARNSVLLC